MRIVGALMITLFVVGIPLGFAALLVYHRVEIVADQTMRERGQGATALTNPNLATRNRYRKLYEDYKPQLVFWKLVLLARKLSFALVVVLLNSHNEAQAGLTVTVLVISYIVHQRFAPYVNLNAISTTLGINRSNAADRIRRISRMHRQSESPGPFQFQSTTGAGERLSSSRSDSTVSESGIHLEGSTLSLRTSRLAPLRRRWSDGTASAAVLYTGVVNYNVLEGWFLIASVAVILLGMVFSSKGLAPGSTLYSMLVVATVLIICTAIFSFVVLMALEMLRAFKFVNLSSIAGQVAIANARDRHFHCRH